MDDPSQPPYSPDGAWWWSGSRWEPTLSQDGRWQWTGVEWVRRPYKFAAENGRVAEYRNNRLEGWFATTETVVMLLLGLLFLIGGIGAGHGAIALGVVLASACWAMFGYRGYVEVVLVADRLETDGEVLRWSGLARHGTWLVRDIATMGRQWATGYVRVGTRNGERLCVRPTKGWEEFAALVAPAQADPNATTPNFMERGLGPSSKFRWRDGWSTRP